MRRSRWRSRRRATVAQPTPDPSSDLVSAVIQDLKEHFLQIKGEPQPHAHRVAPLVK